MSDESGLPMSHKGEYSQCLTDAEDDGIVSALHYMVENSHHLRTYVSSGLAHNGLVHFHYDLDAQVCEVFLKVFFRPT